MGKTKELSKDIRDGTDDKTISKKLGVKLPALSVIIQKWNKSKMTISQPRSGAP